MITTDRVVLLRDSPLAIKHVKQVLNQARKFPPGIH